MNKTLSILMLLVSLLSANSAYAASFRDLMEHNCNVTASQLDEVQFMLKTGVCMGYFSALADLLRSRGVVCGIDNYSVGAMVELANHELHKHPDLAGEPAHSAVMAILSAHFMCQSN
jgi:hypothetical protein